MGGVKRVRGEVSKQVQVQVQVRDGWSIGGYSTVRWSLPAKSESKPNSLTRSRAGAEGKRTTQARHKQYLRTRLTHQQLFNCTSTVASSSGPAGFRTN